MQTQTNLQTRSISAQAMHKYVLLGVGIWFLFLLTFAIAYFRVGRSNQYNGIPLKSLTKAQTQRPASSY